MVRIFSLNQRILLDAVCPAFEKQNKFCGIARARRGLGFPHMKSALTYGEPGASIVSIRFWI